MIKATKAIVDTMGHYTRPDVLRLLVRGEQGWQSAGSARDLAPVRLALTDEALMPSPVSTTYMVIAPRYGM
ncbi:MAG: hypothetical protein WAM82_21195 [Thermoanaerobaculia bacterium]